MKRSGPLKRSKGLRQRSSKTASVERAAADKRRSWRVQAGECMICGHSSKHPNPKLPIGLSKLVGHEISNGPLRQKSLDKPFCVLILCRYCNEHEVVNKRRWPEARQLCVLQLRAPERYDLQAYLQHTNPRAMQRITQAEVDQYRNTLEETVT
jgi:hypothetical protein